MGTRIPFNSNAPFALQIVNETTFNTDPGSGYVSLRHTNLPDIGGLQLRQLPDTAMRTSYAARQHHPASSGALEPGSTLDVVMDLAGLKATTPSGTDMATFAANVARPIAALLESAWGAENATDNYDTLAADTHTTSLLYTSSDAANFTAGAGFVVNTGTAAAPRYEVAFADDITGAATNTIVPRDTLARAADDAGGQSIAGGLTYTPAYPSGSYTLRAIGQRTDTTTPIYVTLTGCGVTKIVISAAAGQKPTITVTFALTAATWTDDSATGAEDVTDNWPHAAPQQYADEDNRFVWLGVYTLECAEWTLTIDRNLQPADAGIYAQGIGGWVATDVEGGPISLETVVIGNHTTSQTLRGYWEAQTVSYSLLWTHGSAPGRIFGWNIPTPHMSAYSEGERNGMLAHTITWRPTAYSGDTDTGGVVDKPAYMFMG